MDYRRESEYRRKQAEYYWKRLWDRFAQHDREQEYWQAEIKRRRNSAIWWLKFAMVSSAVTALTMIAGFVLGL